jgi:hypothetical protein
MADLGEAGHYGINCYQARMAGIWDIATDPRILDHVQDIIGPDIICWASAILSKKPEGSREVPWHQDASFWKLSPARTVTVWLAIDDADEANAAMRFIPGTHDKGEIETVEMGEGSVFHKGIANAEQYGEPFVNALKAGQMSLHADMLMHGSREPLGPAALRTDTALLPHGGAHHRSELGAGRRGDHRRGRTRRANGASSAARKRRHSGDLLAPCRGQQLRHGRRPTYPQLFHTDM